MLKLKKPTRAERELISKYSSNPYNWLIERNSNKELVLVHKLTNKVKRVIK